MSDTLTPETVGQTSHCEPKVPAGPASSRLYERIFMSLFRDGRWEMGEDGSIWVVAVKTPTGNLRSLRTPMRAERAREGGYTRVFACFNKKQLSCLTHRLVWQYFNGDIPVGMVINHLDGNKQNNHPDNLSLVTPGENARHAYQIGLNQAPRGELVVMAKMSNMDADKVREMFHNGKYQYEIAAEFGVSQSIISDIVRYKSYSTPEQKANRLKLIADIVARRSVPCVHCGKTVVRRNLRKKLYCSKACWERCSVAGCNHSQE